MGKLLLLFTCCLFSLTQISAQVSSWLHSSVSIPHGIQYSAVAKDKEGVALANEEITFKIDLLKGSASGDSFYSEKHRNTTNEFGFVSFIIFHGTDRVGNSDSIYLVNGPVFIKLEMISEQLGSTLVGTSEIQSVPFALVTKYAGVAQVAHKAGPFYEVGQVAEGGIVIATWDGGRHGWVVAMEDESTLITWHEAERLVQTKTTGGYRDWKLPNMAQLNLLYELNNELQGRDIEGVEYEPMAGVYWSSNTKFLWENMSILNLPSRDEAFYMIFSGEHAGKENSIDKTYTDDPIGVRGVREF